MFSARQKSVSEKQAKEVHFPVRANLGTKRKAERYKQSGTNFIVNSQRVHKAKKSGLSPRSSFFIAIMIGL